MSWPDNAGKCAPTQGETSMTPAQDATALADNEQFLFKEAEDAYFNAGKTSSPQDWLNAALLAKQHRNALARLRATSQTPDAVREALKWYADKNNWIDANYPDDGGSTQNAIPVASDGSCDCGDVARAALSTPSASAGPKAEAVQPRVTDNDNGEISVTFNGKELRGFIYSDDTTRRLKMLAAREYIEGWCERDAR